MQRTLSVTEPTADWNYTNGFQLSVSKVKLSTQCNIASQMEKLLTTSKSGTRQVLDARKEHLLLQCESCSENVFLNFYTDNF